MEKSLVLVKPDAVERGLTGAILAKLESKDLKLVALKMLQLDKSMAKQHYAVHKEKPFFDGLIKYITSGPIVAAVFEGKGTVQAIRDKMGDTNPARADKGTIRAEFGLDIERNSVHGSDSPRTAENEIKLFFGKDEIMARP